MAARRVERATHQPSPLSSASCPPLVCHSSAREHGSPVQSRDSGRPRGCPSHQGDPPDSHYRFLKAAFKSGQSWSSSVCAHASDSGQFWHGECETRALLLQHLRNRRADRDPPESFSHESFIPPVLSPPGPERGSVSGLAGIQSPVTSAHQSPFTHCLASFPSSCPFFRAPAS